MYWRPGSYSGGGGHIVKWRGCILHILLGGGGAFARWRGCILQSGGRAFC